MDKWNKVPYIVIGVPTAGIPVLQVPKESDTSVVKTLHRNFLLPFSAIPKTSQVEDTLPPKHVCKPRTRQEKANPEPVTSIDDSEHSSESEEEATFTVPSFKSHKRRVNDTLDISRVSNTRDSFSNYLPQGQSGHSNISNITINSSPGPLSNNSSESFSNVQGSDL